MRQGRKRKSCGDYWKFHYRVMEERKKLEIEYYDKAVKLWRAGNIDFEGFNPGNLDSFQFCYEWLRKNAAGKKVLDYGCGNGIHSVFLAKQGAEVVGIDLSEPSLEIARKRAEKEGIGARTSFLLMDCEKMEFPDNSFDIIFDGGTFSSLDTTKAFPELARILKPDGRILGIETFGHNPFTNLKRIINKKTGKRTDWAADHIFNQKDLETAKKYFAGIQTHYFHLISWAAFPFLGLPGGKILLKLLEVVEGPVLKIPFLKKYGFKVVFVFSQPRK